MTDPTAPVTPRTHSIRWLARRDHEANCRNEPEWPNLSISHRHVHEVAAMRQLARMK
jgi:exopolysaccharide biosynthesis predicted pyruvyltransferase EpsI